MTANFGIILERETWEARIIDEDIFSSTPRTNSVERGFVIWDKIMDQRVSLPAMGALGVLTDMREVESWKEEGTG